MTVMLVEQSHLFDQQRFYSLVSCGNFMAQSWLKLLLCVIRALHALVMSAWYGSQVVPEARGFGILGFDWVRGGRPLGPWRRQRPQSEPRPLPWPRGRLPALPRPWPGASGSLQRSGAHPVGSALDALLPLGGLQASWRWRAAFASWCGSRLRDPGVAVKPWRRGSPCRGRGGRP